jgi:hypothetical protein
MQMGIAKPFSGSWGRKAIRRLSELRIAASQNTRFPLVSSSVGAETRNQAGIRSCLPNEVICTGIERGCLVKFALHRREHQNRSCYVQGTKLANHLETFPSPRVGTALRSEVKLHEDRVESCRRSRLLPSEGRCREKVDLCRCTTEVWRGLTAAVVQQRSARSQST